MEDIPVAGVPSPGRPPTAAGTLVLEQEEGLRWLELWLQSSQQPEREKMEPASVAGLAMTPAQLSCSFSAVVCREKNIDRALSVALALTEFANLPPFCISYLVIMETTNAHA